MTPRQTPSLPQLSGCHSRRESAVALRSNHPKLGCSPFPFATAISSPGWAKRHKSLTGATIFFLTLLLPTLPAQTPPQDEKPATPQVVRSGEELFKTVGCLHCHTMNGEGGSKGPDLSGVGRRLKPAAIKLQIQQGKGAMPPFQDALTDDEITALVHYLEKARSKK